MKTPAVLVALAVCIVQSAHALTLPVSEDTSAAANARIARVAGRAATLPVNSSRSALMRFEVSAFSSAIVSTEVVSARLTFYVGAVKQPGELTLHRVTSQWSEAPAFPPLPLPTTGPAIATVTQPDIIAKHFVVVDVTDAVKAWLDAPASDFGFAVSASGTTSVLLGSKEGSGSGYPATLEIDTVKPITALDGAVLNEGSIPGTRLAPGTIGSAQLGANLTLAGTTVGSFSGDGTGLTNLNSESLTGTLSIQRTAIRIASIDTGAYLSGVAVQGNYVYTAGDDGLRIFDVSNPANPVSVGQIHDFNIGYGVALAGRYAYVAYKGGAFAVYNVSNPANPVRVGFVLLSTDATDVAVDGNYAYVAAGTGGLRVFDISNPASPAQVAQIDESTSPFAISFGVAVTGHYVYLANYLDGFRVYDVSNPANPVGVANILDGTSEGVTIAGNYAFFANDGDGLRIYDITNPASPVHVAHIDNGGNASGVAVAGQYAYLANADDGLRIYDISSPANPVNTEHLSGVATAGRVAVAGHFGFIASSSGLRVFTTQAATAVAFSGDGSALKNVIVSAGNISGQLSTSQIADGAVTASKLGADVGLWSVAGSNVYRSNGRVGIGVANPATALHVKQSQDNSGFDPNNDGIRLEAASGKYWTIQTQRPGDLVFDSGTDPAYFYIDRTSGQMAITSDRKLKKDIEPLNDALEKVLQLRPVSFRYKTAPETTAPTLGFIAQEVESVLPELVEEKDGTKFLLTNGVIPVTVAAVQELKKQTDDELEKLRAENAELKRRLEHLEALLEK